tara:strand:- start:4710 stop:5213 length:504 start_codon:yes stop_codon:yes gene_type:complete
MNKTLKMKNLNLFFAATLILLMYKTPIFLTDIAAGMLGRLVLIIILVYTLIFCDFSCSIFFALIIIVLFHNTMEGLTMDGITDEVPVGEESMVVDEEDQETMVVDKEEEDEEEEVKEGFLGLNMISKKVLNKNFIGNLRNSLKSNLTDLDRFLKTNSERNTILSTKQ